MAPVLPLFLTPEELQQLTGYLRPRAQRRWIEGHGYLHETDARGRPIVLRDHVADRLGGTLTVTAREPRLRLT